MRQLSNPSAANRLPQLIILGACLVCFILLAVFAAKHPFGTYATETDFYHLYAPDALRLKSGQFPLNEFQGPGFPAALAVVSRLTGDLFLAGKWISIISGVLSLWLAFVLFKRAFGAWAGLGSAFLLMTCIELPEFSIQATTDVFFLLLCLAALAVFTSQYFTPLIRIAITGFFCGTAYLTRYNALFLVASVLFALIVLNLLESTWRKRIELSAIFLGVFLLTCSPWLIASYRHYGSPFHNSNYLNMATLLYPELAGGEVTQDGTRKVQETFHSFGEVISYKPGQAVVRYLSNLWLVLKNCLDGILIPRWIGWLSLVGLGLALFRKRSKTTWLLLSCIVVFFGLMGLNHWELRYFFFAAACIAGFASEAIFGLFEYIRDRWGTQLAPLPALGISLILLTAVWVPGIAQSGKSFKSFLNTHPNEIPAAAAYVKSLGAAPHSLKIVARKPHLPYLAEQEWVFFPQVKNLEDLRQWLLKNNSDYVAIGKRELKSRKELSALGDSKTAPAWLKPVWKYSDPVFILYRVDVAQSGDSAPNATMSATGGRQK